MSLLAANGEIGDRPSLPQLLLLASLVALTSSLHRYVHNVNSLLFSASKERNSGDHDYIYTFIVWLRNFKLVPWWFWVFLHDQKVAEEEPRAEIVPVVQVPDSGPVLLSWEEQAHWTWSSSDELPENCLQGAWVWGHLNLPSNNPPRKQEHFCFFPKRCYSILLRGMSVYMYTYTSRHSPVHVLTSRKLQGAHTRRSILRSASYQPSGISHPEELSGCGHSYQILLQNGAAQG